MITVEANGLRFEIETAGQGDHLALCLHGFPEHAVSWRHQLPMLADLGYRAWAPNLRGYGNSSRPRRVADYAIPHLVDDVAGLIDAARPSRTVLIAHDWGGALAWCLAAERRRPLDALVILNMPHPLCHLASLRRWRQLRKSWYILLFQLPWLPELLLGRDRAAAIPRLFRDTSREPQRFADGVLETYRAAAAEPGALWAMLAWYRAAMRGSYVATLRRGLPRIETRTLVIWGDADVALDPITLDGTARHVGDLTIRRLPGVSHWVQQEAPETVNRMIAAFLQGRPVPEA